VVGLVGEYDALRGIGHACGHNIIGTAAVGAALALKAQAPQISGTVRVIGTPAEEGGGGKVIMADAGLFDRVDVAILCHPANRSMIMRGGLAATMCTIAFHGKASHAAVAPEKGISALDAVLLLFAGINQLRQFAPSGHRIHGVILKGGVAPNIVPAYAEAEFSIRAVNRKELTALKERVMAIARGAAAATGATLEVKEGLTYGERQENLALSECFASNLRAIGVEVLPALKGIGSSDMGNVGEVCPMAHPYVKIVEEPTELHTPEFAVAAASQAGMDGLIQATKALAMTALDVCYDPALLPAIRSEFQAYRRQVANA
jgi:amidohydrolase